MSKTEEKVSQYAQDIKSKFGENPDMDLLRKVTKACGPSIFTKDAETVSGSNPKEMETVKKNFLIKKLGLNDDSKLDDGLNAVIEKYGKSNRNKYRAVVYYQLAKHFNRTNVFS